MRVGALLGDHALVLVGRHLLGGHGRLALHGSGLLELLHDAVELGLEALGLDLVGKGLELAGDALHLVRELVRPVVVRDELRTVLSYGRIALGDLLLGEVLTLLIDDAVGLILHGRLVAAGAANGGS